MTREAARFAEGRHHPITVALLAFVFWIAAAILVATAHVELDAVSVAGGAVAKIAVIVAVAYAYTRMCARCAGMPHALGVGISWLVLTIAAEIVMTTRLGHGWFALLGAPGQPLLRNLDLFVWIFAPALFARGDADA